MRIYIDNARIITMDEENPVVEKGFIEIEDQRITYVSEAERERLLAQSDRVIDATNKLVLPGLINAHTHVGMAPFRNYASDLPLQTWLFDKLFPMEDKLTEDDVYWGTQLGIAEMLRGGTTCFADMYMFMDIVAEVVEFSGIRAYLTRGLQCFQEDFSTATDRRLGEALQLFHSMHNQADGRIRVGLGPHAVYTCVPGYLREVGSIARDTGAGIHIHLSETVKENEDCYAAHGKTPTEHLADLGLFAAKTIAAHGVHLSRDDMKILQESQVSIIHNPGSNLKLGSGVAHVAELLAAGINVGLGTDSVASNNDLDMVQEMYLAAVLSKGVFQDSVGIRAYDALKLGTINGARALGLDDVGRIRPGMKADLTLIDLDQPHYYPCSDPVAGLVYAGRGSDVNMVMVNGNVLYEDGQYTTLDMERIKARFQEAAQSLFRR